LTDDHDGDDPRMSYLTLTGIQKRFPGGVLAVADFNLAMEKGEFVSFLGPSGCGKTTTLRMIAGFEEPTRGSIVLDGTDITDRPPNRRNVGMVFQAYALFPNMTVADNIGFGLRVRRRDKASIARRTAELLELIGLPGMGDRYPWQMSGGQQQRVALARALAFEPQVLLLDEPLSALDARIRVSLRAEIRAIQRTLGITTVYVTHDQEEALSLSDRIVVMSEGRIEQIGTPFDVYNFPRTPFVARFVGTLNVLSARVVDATAGRLDVGGQEMRTTGAVDAAAGSTVSLALRPEILAMGEGAPQDVRLRGTVDEVTFLGAVVRIRVRLPGDAGLASVDTFNNPHLAVPARDSAVTFSFPAEACLVLDGAGRDSVVAAATAI
jgi:putative spermidine/putrescine transport system ATP-binding protein